MSNFKRVLENDETKKHIDYSLQLNRWFLKSIGAWPQINGSISWKILVLLQIFICWGIVIIITVPCLLYTFFEKTAIQKRLGAMGPLLHRVMGSINYWVLLNRSGDLFSLIRHMETDWNLIQRIDDREIMQQYAKFGRFIAMICGIIMQGGSILFSVGRTIRTTNIIIGNETYKTYPMTCPIYSQIIETRFSPVNEIALIIQFMSTLIVNFSTVGACSMAAVFATHACGQLNILHAWLQELVGDEEKEDHIIKKKVGTIVEHHLRILSFTSRIESIMHKVALGELMGCTLIMCLLGYYMIMAWESLDTTKITSYVLVYLSMGFNIFIFCYIGEIITEQCKLVGKMAYMSNWYNIHHKTARGLILIIARSNNVIKITAGKLFPLSIATFGDVIRTSVVYLNLLRAVAI